MTAVSEPAGLPDRLKIGGNNPPAPTIADDLASTYADQIAEVTAIADRANNAPMTINSDEDLGIIGDIGALAARHSKMLEALRETEKKPHLQAGREVDAFFKTHTDRLSRIVSALRDRATAYNRAKAEKERAARAQAEREARERAEAERKLAEEAAAAGRVDDAIDGVQAASLAESAARDAAAAGTAKAADITRVRSDAGTTITTKTELAFEIVDYDAIDLNRLRPYLARADVEKAIRALMRLQKGGAALAGVRFFEKETAEFR